jgi:hypothetical protein
MLSHADVAVADTSWVPTAATTGKRGHWSPVEIIQSAVTIKGGFCKTPTVATTIDYNIGTTTHRFVEMDKNAVWFLKGVGGPKTQKGELKAVQVLQEIREKFQRACVDVPYGHDLAVVTGEEGDTQYQDADDDPMNALDDVVDTLVKPHAKATYTKTKRSSRASVHDLEMPMTPPCAGFDNPGTKIICVYRKPGSNARNKENLYLRADCIGWLLSYAADELHFQGVACTEPEPIRQQTGNCTAVADLYLEWDFGAKTWTAEFVAGPFARTARRFCVTGLTRERWSKMKADSIVGDYLCQATNLLQKHTALAFITMWCQAIVRNEGDDFESTWGLRGDEFDTPSPKRRLVVDDGPALAAVLPSDADI